ncbi:hypothetical protein G6539_29695 [Streptomyces albidoflavus]|nr:hypothetical protein [Streptomyces albidoflavus]
MNQPAVIPATTGIAAQAQVSGVPGPSGGNAASSGKGGRAGPEVAASGVTRVSVPTWNPVPSA